MQEREKEMPEKDGSKGKIWMTDKREDGTKVGERSKEPEKIIGGEKKRWEENLGELKYEQICR